MTQNEINSVQEIIKNNLNNNSVTIWDLIMEFIQEVGPIFVDGNLNYNPIKKYQIGKLWRLSKAVYKFISSLKKL